MPATAHSRELAVLAAEAAADKLAGDVVAFDVSDHLVFTDVFVLCSGANDRQVRSIVDGVQRRLQERGVKAVRREGETEGRWVLLDFLDIIVHVQHAEERTYYALERLWKDCPDVPLPEAVRHAGRHGSADGGMESDFREGVGLDGVTPEGANPGGESEEAAF